MDASSPPSNAGRELDELRRRAYGPHPDIQDDPAAQARLTELEAGRTAHPPLGAEAEIGESAAAADSAPAAGIPPALTSSTVSQRSLWRRLTATRARRRSFVAGALIVYIALMFAVPWLVGSHPDATLDQIVAEPDGLVHSLLADVGADADLSSIWRYESYRGIEPWFFVFEGRGLHCFMLIERSSQSVDGYNCVPPGVDLFADVGAWTLFADYIEDLPHGDIIRFHYRGDSVDVFTYPASGTD